jgi:hypothetical protein
MVGADEEHRHQHVGAGHGGCRGIRCVDPGARASADYVDRLALKLLVFGL